MVDRWDVKVILAHEPMLLVGSFIAVLLSNHCIVNYDIMQKSIRATPKVVSDTYPGRISFFDTSFCFYLVPPNA